MRLLLASMPWQALYRPSLSVGILHSLVDRDCSDVDVAEFHGSLEWAEHLARALPLATLAERYVVVSETGLFQGLGELIFSGSLYGDPGAQREEVIRIAAEYGLDVETVVTMEALAPAFIDAAADAILRAGPDVVGLTSTLMQNVSSLAVARQLKLRRPDLRIVMGGANCDGPMGHALHRNHRFVDYVVRGEAELVFPRLLDRIRMGEQVADLAGVCWWDADTSVANPMAAHAVPPARIPMPDYDDWRVAFAASSLKAYLRPELLLEGSRGCWWGEKHHCTFCGLNGSLMEFRSKPADQFWAELTSLVERHQILDVSTADNILDMDYLRTLLPVMTEAGYDLCVHFELKSNMRPEQMRKLAEAGVVLVQPGIESLSGRALELMDKGVDGATNVRTLRAAEEHSMTLSWNHLYGFPGEREEDYLRVLDQIPALVHLQPPDGATRIMLERYSPNFDKPELGFGRRDSAAFYRRAFRLPAAELFDIAYYFDTVPAGIDERMGKALRKAVDSWRASYPYSSLTAEDDGGDIVVTDRRRGWPQRSHRLTGWRAAAYRMMARPRTPGGLRRVLADNDCQVDRDLLDGWLAQCRELGLAFVDDDHWIALATSRAPLKVRRPERASPGTSDDKPPVVLGEQASTTLPFLCMLRDELAAGNLPSWQGDLAAPFTVDQLCYLPPPGNDGPRQRAWRSRFRPGMFYYRHGPGFVQVVDARGAASIRLTIDDPALIEIFTRCVQPTSLRDLDAAETACARALLAEGVLLEYDGSLVTLPHRMRHWPVPVIAV